MSILFKGDNKALIRSITALLALDAKGALSPHGIGEMARDLLETCAARLPAEQHNGEPVAWFTEDHLTDKSATTWDSTVAERWRAKGWPVGELFANAALERKPSALIAQLQADLTARDELIDQLRSGYVFETGPYQVELSEDQWSAALGVFENYNMGDDKHFVFLEEHGRGVISEILIEIGVARTPDADEVAE